MSPRSPDPRLVGLRLLARREYFRRQLHERLSRRDFEPEAIERALDALQASGALDDQRAARAYAHDAAVLKGRARRRTLRELEALGVSSEEARETVEHAYATVDEADLIERALARRDLTRLGEPARFRRLHDALCRQGFDPDRVRSALRARRGGRAGGMKE